MGAEFTERALLAGGASELGIQLTEDQIERLIAFLDLLYLWNRSAGLTTVPREDAVRLHLLDCLAAVPLLAAGTVADLGSGAGLPGIPLALVRMDLRLALVESNRRRCSFLHEALRELQLHAEVVESDAAVFGRSGRQFATVISRAFRQPADLLPMAAPLLSPEGRLVVMTTPASQHTLGTLTRDDFRNVDEIGFTLPSGSEQRLIVVLARRPRPILNPVEYGQT